MILDVAAWARVAGSFFRILVLLVIVGIVIPRVAIMVADFLSLSRLETGPELQFQDHVQRVIGFRRVAQSGWLEQLETWFRMVAVELRHYYYEK